MKITILGNNGPYPSAGGACSGYLLEEGDTKILLDCGNGVLGNLQKLYKLESMDAVILSHLHSDHMSDMLVLKYAIQIKQNKGMMNKALDVFAPSAPADEYSRLNVNGIYNLKSITEELKLRIGDVSISFCKMMHPVMSYAIAAECKGKKFVYSGDTSWNKNIIEFCQNADLIMLDSGLLAKDKSDTSPHLSASECGIIAKKANAKRLLLTHFWPEYNPNDILEEASQNFDRCELTELMKAYEI